MVGGRRAHPARAGGRAAAFCAELLDFYAGTYARAFPGEGAPLHDPLAVLAVTHPELVTTTGYRVVVELRGEHTRGMTLADLRSAVGRSGVPNVEAITHVDAARASEVLIETLSSYA